MKYRLLALDLDGTLLGREQVVAPADRDAIARAQATGCRVVPCTGRGWRESQQYLASVPGLTLGVFNTGAVVAEMHSGRAVDLATFEPHLALELIEFLKDEPEAVLIYQDFERAGCDYLIVGGGDVTANTRDWFDRNSLPVKENREPSVEDLRHSLRVGMVVVGDRAYEVESKVAARFAGRVNLHCFAGVPTARAEDQVYIVEIFAAGVDKWRGLDWIAQQDGILPEAVAAIGDEVNDLAMLREAGLGVAMGNAVPQAIAAANRQTRPQDQQGVAYAIDQMLAGRW